MPTEPPSEDETPKRTRRAPAAKKAVPKKAAPPVKKAAPAVKKATRTVKSAKTPTTTEASTAATDATAVTATTPAPETPASAVDPAEPAAAAGDQALAVDQPAVDESRKTEPPALDPPVEAQPYDKPETLPVTVDVRHAARTPEKGWRAVGPQLRDHPGFAPELLALAAVDALGPRAREWVAQVRRAYPEADADGVARLATRRFVPSGWPVRVGRWRPAPGCSRRSRSWQRCCGRRRTWCCTWPPRTGGIRRIRIGRPSCWC
ncbi:hypothetical protein [Micromonospora sp. D75]|uniref:hypothetical protein n=1 Tax=Micromonospora sp. D75 TaxID=2824885 RepID=UPI001FFCB615|nr:hypothetical protein [Micromonospora sp. D75]